MSVLVAHFRIALVQRILCDNLVGQPGGSMDEVGIFEAKTRFSEIPKQVKESGRAVRVTSRGEEMVDITPVAHRLMGRRTGEEAFEELCRLRRKLFKGGLVLDLLP
jgi:prevent-host-death family protein